jgi:hypothetical protein
VTTLFVDCSFVHPNPAAIKAAGYSGVLRYLGGSASKDLTAKEAAGYHAAGLSIGLVYESTAGRAKGTYAQGQVDAHTALAQAKAIGYPTDCPIFFAVDFDATPAQVERYFDGVRSAIGTLTWKPGKLKKKQTVSRAGIYGGIAVTSAGLAPWRWQTEAWSGTRVDQSAHLYQRVRATVKHPIASADEDVVLQALPLWGPKKAKKVLPVPATPAPAPAPAPGLTADEIARMQALWNELAALMLKAVGK